MRILVPVDFSSPSLTALDYAMVVADQCSAEIIVVHILPDLGPTLGRQPTAELMNEMVRSAESELKNLIDTAGRPGLKISSQVTQGAAVCTAILPLIEIDAIDVIVMGTKGASEIRKVIFGSNTVDVINHTSIPVIAVPENTVIHPVEYILYASDFMNTRSEVKYLVPLAKMMHAAIRIINMPPTVYTEYLDSDRLIDDLKKECGFDNIEISLVKGDNVIRTLEDYAAASKGELLTMFTHKTSFFEQLFKRSITREIVWHGKIPLLVINSAV